MESKNQQLSVYKTSKTTWFILGFLAIIAIIIVMMMMKKGKPADGAANTAEGGGSTIFSAPETVVPTPTA